jgi:hypothetical protein
MHDALTIGIPLLVILFGILWNQQGLRDLRAEMRNEIGSLRGDMSARFNGVDGRLDRMQSDLSQFYRDLGDHGARIDAIEKKQQR